MYNYLDGWAKSFLLCIQMPLMQDVSEHKGWHSDQKAGKCVKFMQSDNHFLLDACVQHTDFHPSWFSNSQLLDCLKTWGFSANYMLIIPYLGLNSSEKTQQFDTEGSTITYTCSGELIEAAGIPSPNPALKLSGLAVQFFGCIHVQKLGQNLAL